MGTANKPPSVVVEYLRAKAQEWMRVDRERNTQAVLVARTRLSKSAISQFINGVGLGRRENQDVMAKALGLDPDRLRADAEAWAAANPNAVPARTVVREDRYPSRAVAIAFARAEGIADDVLAAVAAIALDADEDPGPQFWLDECRSRARAKRIAPPPVNVSGLASATRPTLPKRKP